MLNRCLTFRITFIAVVAYLTFANSSLLLVPCPQIKFYILNIFLIDFGTIGQEQNEQNTSRIMLMRRKVRASLTR